MALQTFLLLWRKEKAIDEQAVRKAEQTHWAVRFERIRPTTWWYT